MSSEPAQTLYHTRFYATSRYSYCSLAILLSRWQLANILGPRSILTSSKHTKLDVQVNNRWYILGDFLLFTRDGVDSLMGIDFDRSKFGQIQFLYAPDKMWPVRPMLVGWMRSDFLFQVLFPVHQRNIYHLVESNQDT